MLGFAPYLCTWEGRKLQNWSGAILSAHLACELQTLLAKCTSRAQAKCTFNLEERSEGSLHRINVSIRPSVCLEYQNT
jgi:hypothetical protein